MSIKNYIKLTDFSLFDYNYAFLDLPDFMADQLFIKNEVHVRFKKHYQHPEWPYLIIFCKIRKKDEDKFLRSLDELINNMLLSGEKEYERCCKEFIEEFDK